MSVNSSHLDQRSKKSKNTASRANNINFHYRPNLKKIIPKCSNKFK